MLKMSSQKPAEPIQQIIMLLEIVSVKGWVISFVFRVWHAFLHIIILIEYRALPLLQEELPELEVGLLGCQAFPIRSQRNRSTLLLLVLESGLEEMMDLQSERSSLLERVAALEEERKLLLLQAPGEAERVGCPD